MSAAALYDSITRIARHEAAARAVAGIGRVTDLFSEPDHAVTVEMRDSGLLLPRVPVAVGAMGFGALPAVDDLVVVLFLEGDYNAPVVVGRIYHPDQAPPSGAGSQMVLGLPSGAQKRDLNLIINGADPSLKLALTGDVSIEVTGQKAQMQVGEMRVNVDGAGGGRVEVAAGGSSIILKKDGDITVSAAGNLKLEGTQIEINGSAKVKIAGALVEMN